jgi:hypothetical protein
MVSLQPKNRMIYPEKSIVYCNSNRLTPVSRHLPTTRLPKLTPQSHPVPNDQDLPGDQDPCRRLTPGLSRSFAPGLVVALPHLSVPLPGHSISNPLRLSSRSSDETSLPFSSFPKPRCSTFPVRPRLTLRVHRFYVLRPSFSFPLSVCFFSFIRLHSRLMR